MIGSVVSTVEIDENEVGKIKYGRGRVNECLVQHNLHLKDPKTGAHTNAIEATWSAIKRALKNTPHKADYFDSYLFENVWRKNHDHSVDPDTFKAFKHDVIKVYTPWVRDHADYDRSSAS
ncbi:hypothetical protein HNY73_014726 [Argiope bruennichi]|uniref:ISXO2-like transposase domain-containing protein n=1 Tax=Argiope bruennichi TaxID=94029 RepID=A0A8T0EU91_ARGBR|nr:hypothetical protein HNY73_014726 [Argiope bruennichi]